LVFPIRIDPIKKGKVQIMQKIKAFKVTSLSLEGFRTHKNKVTLVMGDYTFISGDNGMGKSSIAHAIAYALYGVDAFGNQDIKSILNEESKTVSVNMVFSDHTGTKHTFSRTRTGNNTELQYDGYKIQQKDVNTMFGDKDTFLSLFNPTYFVEIMGNRAKEFLELRLPIIKHDEVFAKLSEHERQILCGSDLTVPEAAIKKKRAEIKQMESNCTFIGGQIAELSKAESEKATRLTELEDETTKLGRAIKVLQEKQFSGVDVDELNMEKCMLDDRLSRTESAKITQELKDLESILTELEIREYRSSYAKSISEIEAKLSGMAINHGELKQRLEAIRVGDRCPSCMVEINDDNIDGIKAVMQSQVDTLRENGRAEKLNLNELKELDMKARERFEEITQDDTAKTKRQIADFKKRNPDNTKVYNRVNEINDILLRGNLSEDEHTELILTQKGLDKFVYEYNALQNSNNSERIAELQAKMGELETAQAKSNELIIALNQYTAKRSELALAGLKMPNVKIQLHEIINSTGELKPCFKFLYSSDGKGREYHTHSLAERIKAGLEVAAMLRELVGLDYPVFIDNSESIGRYDGIALPQQVLVMKFDKDAPLKVKFRNVAKVPQVEIIPPKIEVKEAA
jgi:DNA repair exonuclease SbcCD ATPase subunit